jgi:hypothetical protein
MSVDLTPVSVTAVASTAVPPIGVVTAAAAGALGDAFAEAQPGRDELGRTIEKAVQEAVAGAQRGAAEAGRAAADADRLAAEIKRAQDAVNQIQAEGQTGNLSITRDGPNIVIHTPEGRMITLDHSLVPPPAIEAIVAQIGAHQEPPPFPPREGPSDNTLKLVGVLGVCLTLMVIMVAWARAFGRRATARAATAGGVSPDLGLRLERIEQAVDAMAVEMERVSEAQRYSARLLTERLPDPTPQLAGAPGAHAAHDRR